RRRERRAAELCVEREYVRLHRIYECRALGVPELTAVEVARYSVEPGRSDPAEHDVARRLHQALTLDHALAVVGVAALAQVRLEHRRLGLLRLQEQRVIVV